MYLVIPSYFVNAIDQSSNIVSVTNAHLR